MAFVHEQQRIFGQIFEQCRRWFPGQAAGQEAAVVLDTGTASGGCDHLQIEVGALFQPLVFQKLALGLQFLQPLGELELDGLGRLLQRRPGRDIVAVGVDLHAFQVGDAVSCQRVELGDRLDLLAEEADPPGHVLIVGREDFQRVALHAEAAARKAQLVALVLQGDELAHDLARVVIVALLQAEGHRRIGLNRADTVKAGDRGDDQHVVAFQKRPGCGVAHPVDGFVYELDSFSI
jgi:hypothetical protein